ncbi:MAG: reverse transcriptase family protein [Candidatus Thiodiazotropha endolucinida]|nr:reverse transcriptase family protein [Candidatus Thiodiazotropha taylori]MCW4250372.1 reverse transcriptase family protein [Candidatus Thiodiazotropha endolucinida]
MSVELNIYKARVGLHNFRNFKVKGLGKLNNFELLTLFAILLYQAGDVEKNPGPTSESSSESSGSFHFPPLHGNLSMVHYNVQSVSNKLDVIEAEFSDFSIISLTETWLNESKLTEDLTFNEYQKPFRRDRVGDSHGGILVYVKRDIPCKRRSDLEIANVECIWIEVNIRNKKLLLGTFYRPPNASPLILSNIEQSIGLAVDTGIENICITGDLNLNMLNRHSMKKIIDICQSYNLHQLIDEPTHFTETSSSILDLILINNVRLVEISGVSEPFLLQDIRYHCPVFAVFSFTKPHSKTFTRDVWLYEQGDFDTLRQRVAEFDWDSIKCEDVNQYAVNFTNVLTNLAKECIPNKKVRVRPQDLPWINGTVRKLMRKRNRLYKKYKLNKTAERFNAFKKARNDVTTLLRKLKREYFTSLAEKLKTSNLSSSDYWKTLKSFIKPTTNSSIPPIFNDGSYVSDNNKKAKLLNDFFVNQTNLDDANATLPNVLLSDRVSLDNIIFSPDEVKSVLQTLKLGKSSGPDNINNRILKELAYPISKPLSDLFNYSLSRGSFPDTWKQANVSPLYKKDDPSLVSNYRPISLLSAVGKTMEKIVHKHIFNYFEDNNIITCLQSGFVPGDSTVNQLVDIYNTFCKALDDGLEVRAIFCDISKAFDRVWHKGLLFKLKRAGINGLLLDWLEDYLSDRKQRVVIPGGSSQWEYIKAGVPQGSILGPLLFLLYINDVVQNVQSCIKLFADDTSLYIIVDNPINAAMLLNSDLETIHKWAETWLVKFNPSKSESLLVSRKTNINRHPPLVMNNEYINEVTHHKHLGIFLSNDGTWHEHINYITSKAWQRIYIVRKLKFLLDRDSLNAAYISFIRPVLEYADIVWDNCTQYEIDLIEKIQIEAARIVTGATRLASFELLYRETGWEPLYKRRYKHKMFQFYKMYSGLSPTYLTTLVPLTVENTSTYNLRGSQNFRPLLTRTQLYYKSFLPSCIREWNELPLDFRSSPSLASFKHKLNADITKVPKYYSTGNRAMQIYHTRLRTKCSSLNQHLFSKNLIENPLCECGIVETTKHFLLECPRFIQARTDMLDTLSTLCIPTLNVLLYGDDKLDFHQNKLIFLTVQHYISESRRFTSD